MLRFMVCNLADEIFGEHYRCRSVDIGGQQVVLLLLTNSGRLGEEYVLCFSRLQKFCRKELKLAVYGAVGNTVDNQNDLYLSYHTALRYMDMGRLVGKKDLLGPENTLRSSYQKKNQQLADAMEEYTALHYADPELSLKSIAQVFHFSPTYLGKIYKSVKAKSYASYLINFRLEYSKTLLSETNQSINEVATAVGFINSSYYATVFKSTYGMTPSSYRNHMKHL